MSTSEEKQLIKEILQFREKLERQWPRLVNAAPCRSEAVLEDAFVLAWRHRATFDALCKLADDSKTAAPSFAHCFAEQVKQAYRLHGEGRGVLRSADEIALLRALRGAL